MPKSAWDHWASDLCTKKCTFIHTYFESQLENFCHQNMVINSTYAGFAQSMLFCQKMSIDVGSVKLGFTRPPPSPAPVISS